MTGRGRWGWYYLSTILDDYSRYFIGWKLCTNMRAEDVTDTIELALTASGCDQAAVRHKSILGRVYFSQGAKAGQVTEMPTDAGFAEISAQADISGILRAQAKEMGLLDGLKRRHSHRYVIRAQKAS